MRIILLISNIKIKININFNNNFFIKPIEQLIKIKKNTFFKPPLLSLN